MKSLTTIFERVLPHLMIASAAVGVFVLMAVAIFVSILLEKWYVNHEHKTSVMTYKEQQLKMSWSKRPTTKSAGFGKLRPSWQPLHAPAK